MFYRLLKNKPLIKIRKYIFILLAGFIAASCAIERKIAKEYIADVDLGDVLVMVPDYVFKTSLKKYEVENPEEMDDFVLDSLLLTKSLFLQNISDTAFLRIYTENYISELGKYGFDVYTEDFLDTFLLLEREALIINLAQVEIEEYVMPVKDKELYQEYMYYKEIDLNAVSINSWFELNSMNTGEELSEVLFASHFILDDFEGHFKFYPFTGDITYTYEIDTLEVREIYGLAGYLGRKYAGYTYDFLLNMHIYDNLPENIKPRYYFHYDRKKRALVPVEDDRFIIMDE